MVAHYTKNWEGIAEHWALFGRADVAELCCNTHNFLERFFGAFKYTFCQQKRQQRLVDLLRTIVEKVIPHYVGTG